MPTRLAAALATLLVAALLALCAALPARAASLLRDPDIEHGLRQLAVPLIQAAGLSPAQVKILVVHDSKLNAFIVDTEHVLIHSGLILKVKRPEELQAAIAHELAHIANGHITRRLANRRAAGGAAKFGLGLALALGAATGNSEAAAGVAIGTSSSAHRVFMGHTRAEESSADQAALRYMSQAGIDPAAMATVLGYFRGQEVLSAGRQDPYVRTHPLTRERIRAVEGYAAALKGRSVEDPAAAYWLARVQGKLEAFIYAPGHTLRKVNKKDGSDIAVMRRAIAWHRTPKLAKARAEIDRLAAMRPNDPFVHELRGQILLESRDIAGAVNAYARAVRLAPRDPLILASYGRALVLQDTAKGYAQALRVLEEARTRDAANPRLLRDLAVAYAKTGNPGMASVTTAERYALQGQLDTAKIHVTRASGLLPQGSPGWNRAQDILVAARQAG